MAQREKPIQNVRLEELCERLEQGQTPGARPQSSEGWCLGEGVWGAKLVELLRGLYGDYEHVRMAGLSVHGENKDLFDGSLYEHHLDTLRSIEDALVQGVLAKEPPMMFLAARCREALMRTDGWSISFDGYGVLEEPLWGPPLESARELYLFGC